MKDNEEEDSKIIKPKDIIDLSDCKIETINFEHDY